MKTLYTNNNSRLKKDNPTQIDGFYLAEEVIEHNGYKFQLKCSCSDSTPCGLHTDQALYVMENGHWVCVIDHKSVGVPYYSQYYGFRMGFDNHRDKLFKAFKEYINKVY